MENINHLYWRAGFGLGVKEWTKKSDWSVTRAVEHLFAEAGRQAGIALQAPPAQQIDPGMSEGDRAESRKKERRLVVLQSVDWIYRMASEEASPLLERMSLFWHGHFACQSKFSVIASNQLNTIRRHALGYFRDLVLAMARDPGMIRFLNNQQNRKQKPNENFARELMELFTIGRGHYTEQDVKEAARAFTGWSSNFRGEFIFRPGIHDYGRKTFFGKTGRFDGTDIIDMILQKRETAAFLCRKIYRYFVNEQIDEQIVALLAGQFYNSGYDIGQLMRSIFTSQWFYLPHNQGCKIKSPVELMAGIIRSLNVRFENERALAFLQRSLGQSLFNPPNVAGWPGNKNWVDNSTLMLRLNLPAALFDGKAFNFKPKDDPEARPARPGSRGLSASLDLDPLYEKLKGKSIEEQQDLLSRIFLLQKPNISASLFRQLSRGKTAEESIRLLVLGILSLPEYQMC